jgi:hypothetical protein
MGSIILCESDGCALYAFNVPFLNFITYGNHEMNQSSFVVKTNIISR